MNSMELKPIFEKIKFAERYRTLCDTHQDFGNRLRGVHAPIYKSALEKIGYEFKYYSNGNFYQIINVNDGCEFMLNLILKDGLVESLLYIKINNNTIIPHGRFDFLPEDMDIPFERKRHNLPMYGSEAELEEILRGIFSIYEDIKKEVMKKSAEKKNNKSNL